MDEKTKISIAMTILLTLYQQKEVTDNNIATEIINEMKRIIKRS